MNLQNFMMNKRASWFSDNWIFILIAVLVFIFFALGNQGLKSVMPDGATSFTDAYRADAIGFEKAFAGSEGDNGAFKVLNYIFGTIPGYLVQLTNEFSAAIIVIGIWLLFMLAFGDIMTLFGMFTKNVGWVAAIILTVIVANIKLIKVIAIVALTLTAGLGAISVVASILFIFVLFIAFHFGTSSIRRKIILRRAEDSALRAVAGGKKAASGIDVLKQIAKQAEKDEK
jgi:hypothetical protein